MVGPNGFIVEYHLVYMLLIIYLAAVQAGRIFGLEGWLEKQPGMRDSLAHHRLFEIGA